MRLVKITGNSLKLEDVRNVAVHSLRVTLSDSSIKKIEKSHRCLLNLVKKGDIHYGVNTGFGLLANVIIEPQKIEELQYNILRSHAVGVGHYMPDSVSRAMLLLRANQLASGYSGVSLKLVKQIIKLLNKKVHPLIPQQGSVGASGDLAPLAHLALVLIGEGRANYLGKEMSGKKALKKAGIKPIRLGAKEGLALINGTQFMTALGVLSLLESEHLCNIADLTGALTLEALRGTSKPFSKEIHEVRPHPGQIKCAAHLRKILNSGGKSELSKSHEFCSKVQDPYSLRCMPQVHGATRDALSFIRNVLQTEINSVTDNPLVFSDTKKRISGGNFHGQILAISLDLLAISIAELASISEQRIQKLINPAFSDLPGFLTKQGGLNSGFMIVQVAAASIVSENKGLCHPASVDSIPTSADQEDHVSMGAWAARKAGRVVTNTRRVLAMEVLSAAQGLDLLRPAKTTRVLEKFHKKIRTRVPKLKQDREFRRDIQTVEKMIENYEFLDCLP